MKRAILALAILGSMAPPVSQAAGYVVSDLGIPAGLGSWAVDINNSGQIVGVKNYSSPNTTNPEDDGLGQHGFLYSNGSVTDLGTLGGKNSFPGAINGHGEAVGYANTSLINPLVLEHPHWEWDLSVWNTRWAFSYRNGTMTGLGTMGGDNSGASGINDSGIVVGYSETSQGAHAFRYIQGTMTDLGTLGGNTSSASDINNRGEIVGEADIETGFFQIGASHAFIYRDGAMSDLGTLGGKDSGASGINNLGQVVGWADVARDAATHGFLYSDGKMTDLGTLGGRDSFAADINDKGLVVGYSAIAGDGSRHAFVFLNGQMIDLNTLLPADSGWTLREASAINDKGQIVGWGSNGQIDRAAFLLTPVPVPAAIWLMASALAGLSFFGRSRKA